MFQKKILFVSYNDIAHMASKQSSRTEAQAKEQIELSKRLVNAPEFKCTLCDDILYDVKVLIKNGKVSLICDKCESENAVPCPKLTEIAKLLNGNPLPEERALKALGRPKPNETMHDRRKRIVDALNQPNIGPEWAGIANAAYQLLDHWVIVTQQQKPDTKQGHAYTQLMEAVRNFIKQSISPGPYDAAKPPAAKKPKV